MVELYRNVIKLVSGSSGKDTVPSTCKQVFTEETLWGKAIERRRS